jgi:peroxiredoxin Q/BCP
VKHKQVGNRLIFSLNTPFSCGITEKFAIFAASKKTRTAMMNIGDKAPEVLGKDENGKEVRLSDYKGRKLVLYFYPKDNTSGCTAEACSLRDHYGELQGKGYEVVGVSKDSAASHVKFKEKHELPFPLIADVDHTLLEAMGAWGEKNMYGKKTMGTIRTTFIINEEGIIEQIYAGKQVKTKEHAQQILEHHLANNKK